MNPSDPTLASDPSNSEMGQPEAKELLRPYRHQIEQLRDCGHDFWRRGWSLGTSSNYSIVVNRQPLTLLVTASGMDKGHLGPDDFVLVDAKGAPTTGGQPKSSAETLLHCAAAEHRQAGCILHTHSVWGTLLSDHYRSQAGILIEGFEMLKGLAGITTHEHAFWLPIHENTQDIPELASRVISDWMAPSAPQPSVGFLIRRHGLYAWGADFAAARRHIEVLEFLLECLGRRSILGTR
jgi:methylthioribulose-1-phosphate dehydratase